MRNKVYLDQIPDMHASLKHFAKNLDLDHASCGAENWFVDLECRGRDGFIPHSHNHGGFDVWNVYEFVADDSEDGDGGCTMHGIRFMYEGQDEGIHTLCAYYCQWHEDDVYGISKAPTLNQIEIHFKTTNELIDKLSVWTNELY